jgi:hypothetical protein
MTTFPQRKGPSGPENNTGGGVPPLSTAFYIDANQSITDRDGSIGKPWVSIQEAYDNIPSGSDWTFLCTASSNGNLEIAPGDTKRTINIQGIANDNQRVGATVFIGDIFIGQDATVSLSFQNCTVNSISADTGATGNIEGTGVNFAGVINTPESDHVELNDCNINGDITALDITLIDVQFLTASLNITVPSGESQGVIRIDGVTNYSGKSQGANYAVPPTIISQLFDPGVFNGEPLVWDASAQYYRPQHSAQSFHVGATGFMQLGTTGGQAFFFGDSVAILTASGGGNLLQLQSEAGQLEDLVGNVLLRWGTTGIGVFGASQQAKPTVAGSRGGNAALTSLLTALATLGWITNSTTA